MGGLGPGLPGPALNPALQTKKCKENESRRDDAVLQRTYQTSHGDSTAKPDGQSKAVVNLN